MDYFKHSRKGCLKWRRRFESRRTLASGLFRAGGLFGTQSAIQIGFKRFNEQISFDGQVAKHIGTSQAFVWSQLKN